MRTHAFLETHQFADPEFPLLYRRGEGAGFLAHWHPEVELLQIQKGAMTVGIDREQRLLGPGSLVVAGSNEIHWYDCPDDDVVCRFVLFRPELIGRPAGWPQGLELPGLVLPSDPGAAVLGGLFDALADEMEARRNRYTSMARGQLTQLCALLERYRGRPPADAEARQRQAHQQQLRNALDFVHQNFRRPIGLVDAARASGWTPSHFSRVFAQAVGTSFRSYLNRVRIEAAEILLKTTGRSVTDIAFEAGFDNLRTFHRAFRTHRGAKPREVR